MVSTIISHSRRQLLGVKPDILVLRNTRPRCKMPISLLYLVLGRTEPVLNRVKSIALSASASLKGLQPLVLNLGSSLNSPIPMLIPDLIDQNHLLSPVLLLHHSWLPKSLMSIRTYLYPRDIVLLPLPNPLLSLWTTCQQVVANLSCHPRCQDMSMAIQLHCTLLDNLYLMNVEVAGMANLPMGPGLHSPKL